MFRTPVSAQPARRFSPRPVPRATHIHFGDGKVLDGGPVKYCHHLHIGDVTGAQFGLLNLPDCAIETWSVGGRTALTIYGAGGGVYFHRCVPGDTINVKIPERFSHDVCDEPQPGDPHPIFALMREWGMDVSLQSLSVPEMTSYVPKDVDWVNGPELNAVIAKPEDAHPPVNSPNGIPLWLIRLHKRRPNHLIVHSNWHKAVVGTMRSLNIALQHL